MLLTCVTKKRLNVDESDMETKYSKQELRSRKSFSMDELKKMMWNGFQPDVARSYCFALSQR